MANQDFIQEIIDKAENNREEALEGLIAEIRQHFRDENYDEVAEAAGIIAGMAGSLELTKVIKEQVESERA